MKKLLLASLALAALGLLVVTFAIPAFANGEGNTSATTQTDGAWETMYQACKNGDWQAMAEAAKELHGEDFGYMPCHSENPGESGTNSGNTTNSWGNMSDHMSGGMMQNGWQSMHGR